MSCHPAALLSTEDDLPGHSHHRTPPPDDEADADADAAEDSCRRPWAAVSLRPVRQLFRRSSAQRHLLHSSPPLVRNHDPDGRSPRWHRFLH